MPGAIGNESRHERLVIERISRSRNYDMGELTDKIKGSANKATGKAKQAIGKATDNEKLQAEGVVQETAGGLQKAKGSAKGAINKM